MNRTLDAGESCWFAKKGSSEPTGASGLKEHVPSVDALVLLMKEQRIGIANRRLSKLFVVDEDR